MESAAVLSCGGGGSRMATSLLKELTVYILPKTTDAADPGMTQAALVQLQRQTPIPTCQDTEEMIRNLETLLRQIET